MLQKGSAIRGTLRALAQVHGDKALAGVMARVPGPVRRQLEPIVLATNWYPIETVSAVHLAIRDTVGNGTWEVSRALGERAFREDLSGIHRALLSTLDLEMVFERSQSSWNRYHTQGRVTWNERGSGSASGTIDEVEGFNDGVWAAVGGRIQTLFEMVGFRGAIVDVVRPSPIQCGFELTWLE